jgi:hypothetical protein
MNTKKKMLFLLLSLSFARPGFANTYLADDLPLLQIPTGSTLSVVKTFIVRTNDHQIVEGDDLGSGESFQAGAIYTGVLSIGAVGSCTLYGAKFQNQDVVLPAGTKFTITNVIDVLPKYSGNFIILELDQSPEVKFFCEKYNLSTGVPINVGVLREALGQYFRIQ